MKYYDKRNSLVVEGFCFNTGTEFNKPLLNKSNY
jgi:hypothetical protein